MGDFEAFLRQCKKVRKKIESMRSPLVIHHYDCDGIASGAIVAGALEKQGKEFRVKSVRKIDDKVIESLSEEKELVFVDLGSGTPEVASLGGNMAIIDHHQPKNEAKDQLNPHHFGFDGGLDVSASGCAFFVFQDFHELALVGAVGDIQMPAQGLNSIILEEAIRKGKARTHKDLVLFGKTSRPLCQFLMYSDDPVLPGLSGNEQACNDFLSDLGIEQKKEGRWRTYSDLAEEEKKTLVSELSKLVSARLSSKAASKLIGEAISFPCMPSGTLLQDASEFSTLLNACGRNGRPDLGVSVCLMKNGAYQEASSLLAKHRQNLKAGLAFATKNTMDLGAFLFLDARGAIPDSIIGIVAGMVYSGSRQKPILAASLEESGKIKLSARGTRQLVEKGLNLGEILGFCCASCGGFGGGHKIAAGATISQESFGDFLKCFASRLSQLPQKKPEKPPSVSAMQEANKSNQNANCHD